jgi:hypothetical protein
MPAYHSLAMKVHGVIEEAVAGEIKRIYGANILKANPCEPLV